MSLYEEISEPVIRKVIEVFYKKVFLDPIICHLFIAHDILELTAKQQDFVINMLGGPSNYSGKTLKDAHLSLSIRRPHFARRELLLMQALDELNVPPRLANQWLQLEKDLETLIVNAD